MFFSPKAFFQDEFYDFFHRNGFFLLLWYIGIVTDALSRFNRQFSSQVFTSFFQTSPGLPVGKNERTKTTCGPLMGDRHGLGL